LLGDVFRVLLLGFLWQQRFGKSSGKFVELDQPVFAGREFLWKRNKEKPSGRRSFPAPRVSPDNEVSANPGALGARPADPGWGSNIRQQSTKTVLPNVLTLWKNPPFGIRCVFFRRVFRYGIPLTAFYQTAPAREI
jgi:hypothetical protein